MTKILVIDDEDVTRKVLCQSLKRDGFIPFQADNGKEGLEIAKIEKPDLILLDIAMPIMDGLETIKLLRQMGDYGKHVAVVILTNFTPSTEILNKMIEAKPMYYMVKSDWSLEEISEKVKELIGNPNAVLDELHPRHQ